MVFVVILIFLHRSGRLSKAQERVETGLSTIRQTVKRAPNIHQTVKTAPNIHQTVKTAPAFDVS